MRRYSDKEKRTNFETIRKNMDNEDLLKLQKDVKNLEGYLRGKNQEGIDLYLKHPFNKRITNYYNYNTEGRERTMEEAMEYYIKMNFGEDEYNEYKKYKEEKNKSGNCGGSK